MNHLQRCDDVLYSGRWTPCLLRSPICPLDVALAEQALSSSVSYKQNRLQQLRGFYYVAVTRSFSAAAEHLSLSQPAITLQVKALERELGVTLFDRVRGTVHLTSEGEVLLKLAAGIVEGVESLDSRFLGQLGCLATGAISVIAESSAIMDMLPPVVKGFHSQHPGVEIRLRSGTSLQIVDRVCQHDADLGVVGLLPNETATCIPHHLSFLPLTQSEVQMVVPQGHPLSRQPGVSLEEAFAYPVVAPCEDGPIWRSFLGLLERRHVRPQVILRVPDGEARLRYVQEGLGITFATVRKHPSDLARSLVWIPFSEAEVPVRVYWLLTRTGACLPFWARRFADHLIAAARTIGPASERGRPALHRLGVPSRARARLGV